LMKSIVPEVITMLCANENAVMQLNSRSVVIVFFMVRI
jgi:hypothetical protein